MLPEAKSALVLFSGGQDSTICLAWALDRFEHVETIGFSYGQRHAIEMEMRAPIRQAISSQFPIWKKRLGADHVVPLDAISRVSRSALLSEEEFGTRPDGLPKTFVPGRNVVFLTFAAIVASQRGIKTLVGGMCETDFSGYPDCRDDTIKALQIALNLGLESKLVFETPLMWIDKSETWDLAHRLGGDSLVSIVVEETHTCYVGDRSQRNSWGYGCNKCDACRLRGRGWKLFMSRSVNA